MVTKDEILTALKGVIDPEIGINIVDLGLIYEVRIEDEGKVYIKMTFTTPACPLGPYIAKNVDDTVSQLEGVKETYVDVVFDPPWSIDRVSPEIKEKLGLGGVV